jgi:vancomycin permeability regulator SanA
MQIRMVLRLCPCRRVVFGFGVLVGLITYPILLMFLALQHSPSGEFDAAVVFGARVYEDGTPSKALEDRVLAACALYADGQCGSLIFSGGPGDGAINEPQAMRLLALEQGVPKQAIILDPLGVNTAATAMNAAAICDERGWERVVGVSHFYHTPRVQMMLSRAGLESDTQPASMRGRGLNGLPYFMGRESIAWWAYIIGLSK